MAKKSPRKETPSQIAAKLLERKRQDFAAVNLPTDAAELIRNAAIEVNRAGAQRGAQKVNEDSARRLDAFSALKDGMDKGAYDAARRLERDILARRGEGDRGARSERVDCDAGRDIADLIVRAGQDCDYVKSRLSRRDWWLLVELIQPPVDRGHWRQHVFYITGEANPHAQAGCVRSASVNLRDVYEELDQRPTPQRRAA